MACAAPTGDFGRPKATFVNDTVLPLVGREFARARGEPVSYYMLTDRERELRQRSYRLVMPIHRRGFFAKSEVELVRTRIWPDDLYRPDPTLYYRKLVGDGYASSAGRYHALDSEIRADIPLVAPFLAVATGVYKADAARLHALDDTTLLTHDEAADAVGRVYENRRVVKWALAALRWRVESYAYALQRTRIEIPEKQADAVAIALDRLAAEVEDLAAAIAELEAGYKPPAVPAPVAGKPASLSKGG